MNAAAIPAGYVALDPPPPGTVSVVCRADAVEATRTCLARWGTLYTYAATHPARRELRGRAAAYAVPLGANADGDTRTVVVRHGWRGGALRRVRRDLFFPPTRAPVELATSERLRAAGVLTPAVVAYAVYRAPAGLRRVDVVTALVPDGVDLAAVLARADLGVAPRDPTVGDSTVGDSTMDDPTVDGAWIVATAALLAALARAGARHPDLNLKNVLLAPAPDGRVIDATRAWVLDVDVARVLVADVAQAAATATLAANLARLGRSIRKWGAVHVASDQGRAALERALDSLAARARDDVAHGDGLQDATFRPSAVTATGPGAPGPAAAGA